MGTRSMDDLETQSIEKKFESGLKEAGDYLDAAMTPVQIRSATDFFIEGLTSYNNNIRDMTIAAMKKNYAAAREDTAPIEYKTAVFDILSGTIFTGQSKGLLSVKQICSITNDSPEQIIIDAAGKIFSKKAEDNLVGIRKS